MSKDIVQCIICGAYSSAEDKTLIEIPHPTKNPDLIKQGETTYACTSHKGIIDLHNNFFPEDIFSEEEKVKKVVE